jgi:hypothetical protein
VALLCDLLGAEVTQYRRLLRLAWRQTSYLRRQDVQRLEINAEQWQKYLPLADTARIKRETYLSELATKFDLKDDRLAPQLLLDRADNEQKRQISVAVQNLLEVANQLNRQNALNRQLADFCLELAHEESEIFKRGVLEDPSGCYEDDARKTKAPPGKVIIRQA